MTNVDDSKAAESPRWLLKRKNILDEPADVLICSANVNLLLSGGVGADLLARYGAPMQQALLAGLQNESPRCAQRGEVISYAGQELPYKAVLHAVAINGWYESSPAIVAEITGKALRHAAELGAKKVALTALATGFGHLTLAEFAAGMKPLFNCSLHPIEEIVICLLHNDQVQELASHLSSIKFEDQAELFT